MKITTTQLKQIVQETVKKEVSLREASDWSEFDAHLRNLNAYGIPPEQVIGRLIDMIPPDKAKMLFKQFVMTSGFDDIATFFEAFKTMVGEKKAALALHTILNTAKK
jgi:hypothetical protein